MKDAKLLLDSLNRKQKDFGPQIESLAKKLTGHNSKWRQGQLSWG